MIFQFLLFVSFFWIWIWFLHWFQSLAKNNDAFRCISEMSKFDLNIQSQKWSFCIDSITLKIFLPDWFRLLIKTSSCGESCNRKWQQLLASFVSVSLLFSIFCRKSKPWKLDIFPIILPKIMVKILSLPQNVDKN